MRFDQRYRLPRFVEEVGKRDLASYIITIDDAKNDVRQRTNVDNIKFASDIASVTVAVEKKANHISKLGTFRAFFDVSEVLQIPYRPLVSVDKVEIIKPNEDNEEIGFKGVQSDTFEIYPAKRALFGYVVTFKAGYNDRNEVPDAFDTAVRSQMDFIYMRRDANSVPTAIFSKGWDVRATEAIKSLMR
jgi:hypothetical protein